MHQYFHKTVVAILALTLAACASAQEEHGISLSQALDPMSIQKVPLVVEETSNLPFRKEPDSVGAVLYHVDLVKRHNVMIGLNPGYLGGRDLRDGDTTKNGYVKGARHTPYEMFSAPGAFDYVLPRYARNDGVFLENICYFRNAPVYRLKAGVINYIPKELQPPLYTGGPIDISKLNPNTTELRRILARFPISSMPIEVPALVAVVRFEPDLLNQTSADKCRWGNDFTIIADYSGQSKQE